jgi:hypothetical protein
MVIITDGYENSSKEFTKAAVNSLIKARNDEWQFVFLGANQDAIAEAQSFGINVNSALTYASNKEGVESAFYSTSQSIAGLRISSNCTTQDFYDESDRKKQKEAGA